MFVRVRLVQHLLKHGLGDEHLEVVVGLEHRVSPPRNGAPGWARSAAELPGGHLDAFTFPFLVVLSERLWRKRQPGAGAISGHWTRRTRARGRRARGVGLPLGQGGLN